MADIEGWTAKQKLKDYLLKIYQGKFNGLKIQQVYDVAFLNFVETISQLTMFQNAFI